MTHGSLFSGIGGFDLAAQWMGWENKFHCEYADFPRRTLEYYWPNAKSYLNIKTTSFSIWRGSIDVVSGGFPCQGFSQAGLRRGVEDDRYLWPEMLKAIEEIQPNWVVGENVTGILSMADSPESDALVFARVEERKIIRLQDLDEYRGVYLRQEKMLVSSIIQGLEKAGYEVQLFAIPACGVQAYHKRERIWFIANRKEGKLQGKRPSSQSTQEQSGGLGVDHATNGKRIRRGERATRDVRVLSERILETNKSHDWHQVRGNSPGGSDVASDSEVGRVPVKSNSGESQRSAQQSGNGNLETDLSNKIISDTFGERLRREGHGFGEPRFPSEKGERTGWANFPTQSPICSRTHGISSLLDGIAFSKWRSESIKGFGNAVVPQIPFQIFQAIEFTERELTND